MSSPTMPVPTSGDVSKAYAVMIPTIVTTVLAMILTSLRMCVRIRLIKVVDWDDFFNVLALITTLVVMGLVIGATSNGFGRHFVYLDPARASYSIMLLRICEFTLIISTVFVKISISLFLKRLFLTSKRWKMFFWAFIAFNTITSLIDAAVIFPQCTPVEFNWNKSIQGHCWSDTTINALGIVQGTIAAATDIILSVLPVVFLWNIKIIWRVKLGICGIMALGFASGGFAIARTVLVPTLTVTHDPTWDLVPLFLWAILEATFGVIAAAAPSVRPLLGNNSVTTGYSKSKSQSRSLPLQHMHFRHGLRRSRIPGGGSQAGDMDEFKYEDIESDGGSSQVEPWARENGDIVKTTDVEIVHFDPITTRNRVPERSSDEMLISDAAHHTHNH